jgi:hypothetical protein
LPLGSQYFKGSIDNLKIFNNALSQGEVETLYSSIVAETGLVGHWTLDDNAANTTVVDSSSFGNNGTAQQNTSILHATGIIDGALAFNGDNDYIELDSPADLENLPDDDFTISAWIYDTQSENILGTILSAYDDGNGFALRTYGSEGSRYLIFDVPCQTQKADFRSKTGLITPNSWQHIVAVWHAATKTAQLYIDGHEIIYGRARPGIGDYKSDALNKKNIGRLPLGSQYFKGSIDNLKIFNNALSVSEVAYLYDESSI